MKQKNCIKKKFKYFENGDEMSAKYVCPMANTVGIAVGCSVAAVVVIVAIVVVVILIMKKKAGKKDQRKEVVMSADR